MKKTLVLLLISCVAWAQNASRKYLSHSYKQNILEIKTSDGAYRIEPYSESTVETSFIPHGERYESASYAVVPSAKKTGLKVKFSENKNKLYLQCGLLNLEIDKAPFQIQYLLSDSKILSEKEGFTKVNDSTQTLSFNIDSEDELYGGGARALGMNRRGNRLALYNRAHYGYETKAELMNFCLPLVLASKSNNRYYAVHFDNSAIGSLDLDSKKNNTLTYETISGRKTYQVIVGNSLTELTQKYTDLTGKQPLPPRWALGNLSSRFGYHNQNEVENTIKKFQENQIPVDGIILDLYWFGKTVQGTMGNLDWDKDNFPNPEKMMTDLSNQGIKTILITEPFILTTSSKWREAVDQKILVTDKSGKPCTWDFYFGNTSLVDVFKPEGKDWFWNVYKRLIKQGVGGMWGDLGEPEVFPSKAITAAGKADVVHNVYGHQWAKLIAEGYQKDFPEQRPFILMRAGYSGSQRFGMIPWSGDVSRSWGGLQSQMEISLQMGLQGLGYMHSDLGGFAGDYFDNELYLRWLQYGVFQPIFRPHAQEDVASEVARKDVATMAQAKKLVELRYQLMPYNYTLAFENNQTGMPLMRPVMLENSENHRQSISSKSYFWGHAFMVTPISQAGVTTTQITFPNEKRSWFDFYTEQKYNGNSTETVSVATDHIPVYVAGGSFVPMTRTFNNAAQYSFSDIIVHYYYDETVPNSEGLAYNDDGKTPNAFEKGAYEKLKFTAKNTRQTIKISMSDEVGKNYQPIDKKATLVVHNMPMNIKKITVDGQEVSVKMSGHKAEISMLWGKGMTKEIQIQF
ncbi:MAG: DUF4968 domain-containing protein [Bacteroidetes bacterium]|nr:DUF4968 domain-containing protein [Bacteroidota bacterium]